MIYLGENEALLTILKARYSMLDASLTGWISS